MSTLNAHYRLESLMILECVHVCVSHLGLSFPTMQSVEMMNGALRGGPWVGENLEDVKIVAQSVCSHQQHSYNKHTHTVISIRNPPHHIANHSQHIFFCSFYLAMVHVHVLFASSSA